MDTSFLKQALAGLARGARRRRVWAGLAGFRHMKTTCVSERGGSLLQPGGVT